MPFHARPKLVLYLLEPLILALAFVVFVIVYCTLGLNDPTETAIIHRPWNEATTAGLLCPCTTTDVALASFLQFNPPQHQDSNVNTTRYDLCSQVAGEGDAFQFCEATFKAINEEVKRNSFNSPVLLSSEQLRDFVYRQTKFIAGNFYNIFRHSGEIRNLVIMDLHWGNHVVFNNFDGFVSKRDRALKTLDKFYAEDFFEKFINTLDGFDISWTSYLATCNVEYCLETAPKKPMKKTFEVIGWGGGWAAFIIIPCLLFIIPWHLYMERNGVVYRPRRVLPRERGPAATPEIERAPPAGLSTVDDTSVRAV